MAERTRPLILAAAAALCASAAGWAEPGRAEVVDLKALTVEAGMKPIEMQRVRFIMKGGRVHRGPVGGPGL